MLVQTRNSSAIFTFLAFSITKILIDSYFKNFDFSCDLITFILSSLLLSWDYTALHWLLGQDVKLFLGVQSNVMSKKSEKKERRRQSEQQAFKDVKDQYISIKVRLIKAFAD